MYSCGGSGMSCGLCLSLSKSIIVPIFFNILFLFASYHIHISTNLNHSFNFLLSFLFSIHCVSLVTTNFITTLLFPTADNWPENKTYVVDMSSPENPNWIFDYGLLEDIGVPGGELLSLDPPEVLWSSSATNPPLSTEFDESFGNLDTPKEIGSRKRVRSGSCSASGSKACREKMRRDRLNDRFLELASILDPGRPPKMDKAVLLADAARMVTQLRDEAQKLKDSNENLLVKINELKCEKNELRDEKSRLKTEKENLDRQVKALSSQPAFLPQASPIPAPFPAPSQVVGGKLVPFVGYPGVSMWQFMPPTAVDTSQDHVLRPPVA